MIEIEIIMIGLKLSVVFKCAMNVEMIFAKNRSQSEASQVSTSGFESLKTSLDDLRCVATVFHGAAAIGNFWCAIQRNNNMGLKRLQQGDIGLCEQSAIGHNTMFDLNGALFRFFIEKLTQNLNAFGIQQRLAAQISDLECFFRCQFIQKKFQLRDRFLDGNFFNRTAVGAIAASSAIYALKIADLRDIQSD